MPPCEVDLNMRTAKKSRVQKELNPGYLGELDKVKVHS